MTNLPLPNVGDRVEFIHEDFGDAGFHAPKGATAIITEVNTKRVVVNGFTMGLAGIFMKFEKDQRKAIVDCDGGWGFYEDAEEIGRHWLESFYYYCRIIPNRPTLFRPAVPQGTPQYLSSEFSQGWFAARTCSFAYQKERIFSHVQSEEFWIGYTQGAYLMAIEKQSKQ